MGKVNIITPEQKLLLEEFKHDNYLLNNFLFSGGTALSLAYFQHRKSIDLDFFSNSQFDPQIVLTKITAWQNKLNFQVKYSPLETNHVFDLTFPNRSSVKVDFVFYPYKSLNPSKNFDGIPTDSLLDIGVNKLLMVEQRTEVKDFVDLYYVLRDFTLWDLLSGIQPKFNLKIDKLVLASDFLKVEDFDYLPEMLKALKLKTLERYFTDLSKKLGLQTVS